MKLHFIHFSIPSENSTQIKLNYLISKYDVNQHTTQHILHLARVIFSLQYFEISDTSVAHLLLRIVMRMTVDFCIYVVNETIEASTKLFKLWLHLSGVHVSSKSMHYFPIIIYYAQKRKPTQKQTTRENKTIPTNNFVTAIFTQIN